MQSQQWSNLEIERAAPLFRRSTGALVSRDRHARTADKSTIAGVRTSFGAMTWHTVNESGGAALHDA
jgi:hypothetical protein